MSFLALDILLALSLSVRPSVRSSVYVIIIIILLLVSLRLLPGMTLVCCYMDWPM